MIDPFFMSSHKKMAGGQKRQKPKSQTSMSGPRVSAVSYRGPVNAPDVKDGTPVLLNLAAVADVRTVSAGFTGTYSTVVSVGTFTALQDFTDMSALYQEFRCLAISVEFVPTLAGSALFSGVTNPGIAIASPNSPLFLAPYHGDATALTTTLAAFQHQPNTRRPINVAQTSVVKMSETDEAQWFSTTSGTVPVMGIKSFYTCISNGATDTVYYGTALSKALFQFRGRVASATQVSKFSVAPLRDTKDSKSPVPPADLDKKEKVGAACKQPVTSSSASSATSTIRIGNADYVLVDATAKPKPA